MTRFHQWKGRLQNQTEGYPFENDPPFLDLAGNPVFPHEAGVAAYTVDGFPGPVVTFNFLGEVSEPHTIVWQLAYRDISLTETVADANFPVTAGESAADVAAAFKTSLEAEILNTDIVITISGASVTLTCVDEVGQTINGYYLGYAA